MPLESEVKLGLESAEAGRTSLRRAGARPLEARHLEDNQLFDLPGRPLAARGSILRLRRTPHGARLTFKGPGPGAASVEVKLREEVELEVADGDAAEALLQRLGYEKVFRYQKYRESYALDETEVVLDETPLGVYLEIEGEADAIHRVAARLGFGRESYLTASYVELFHASGRRGDMVFP